MRHGPARVRWCWLLTDARLALGVVSAVYYGNMHLRHWPGEGDEVLHHSRLCTWRCAPSQFFWCISMLTMILTARSQECLKIRVIGSMAGLALALGSHEIVRLKDLWRVRHAAAGAA